jgi:hypothetical protein
LSTAAPHRAADWIERLSLIPDASRSFDIDLKAAEMHFGIDEELSRQLMDLGIAHESYGREARFTEHDLHYVGVRLGTAAPYLDAMRSWAHGLASSRDREARTVSLRYVPYVAAGSPVDVLLPDRGVVSTKTEADRTAARIEASVRCNWPGFDPALSDLLEYVSRLDFCLLPEPLYADLSFVRRTRLANCASAAGIILDECRRLGAEARMAFGLLLGSPFATPRNWAEIRMGETWVPADPLLLATLRSYAGLDAAEWPATRSPGAVLLRLADERAPIITADGAGVAASFIV